MVNKFKHLYSFSVKTSVVTFSQIIKNGGRPINLTWYVDEIYCSNTNLFGVMMNKHNI